MRVVPVWHSSSGSVERVFVKVLKKESEHHRSAAKGCSSGSACRHPAKLGFEHGKRFPLCFDPISSLFVRGLASCLCRWQFLSTVICLLFCRECCIVALQDCYCFLLKHLWMLMSTCLGRGFLLVQLQSLAVPQGMQLVLFLPFVGSHAWWFDALQFLLEVGKGHCCLTCTCF